MPVVEAPAPRTIRFAVSAAVDLFWALMAVGRCDEKGTAVGDPDLVPLLERPELVRAVHEFWDEGPDDFSELLVLAEAAGVLLGDVDLAAALPGVVDAAQVVARDLPLRSETPESRAVILRRLGVLRDDAATRRRYRDLALEVWGLVGEGWRAHGLPRAQRTAERCQERAARNLPWANLLLESMPLEHCLEDAFARAGGDPVVVVAAAYGGTLTLDLATTQLIALRALETPRDPREDVAELARRARALGDPTRLALVSLLVERPRSVGELARSLDISQPTVSNHVKLLREAGIVRIERSDGRQQLSVDQPAVAGLLGDLSERLGIRGGAPATLTP